MAATVDATATAAATTASATTLTNSNLTVGAGSTALLAVLTLDGLINLPTSITVQWDSAGTPQTMTQLAAAQPFDTNVNCFLFGLVNPTAGNKALTATWTGAAPGMLDAISFNGTINTTVANAFLHAATNTGVVSSAPIVSVTSAVGNIVVATMAEINAVTSLTATSSTSVRNFTDTNGFGFTWSRAPGAATVAWTGAPTSTEWAIAGVDVVALTGPVVVAPGTGALTVTGRAPIAGIAVTPGGGGEFSSEFSAAFDTGGGGSFSSDFSFAFNTSTSVAAQITITGFAPRVDRAAAPAAAALVVTGRAPAIGLTVAPGGGALLFTGFIPLGVAITPPPGTGSVVITGLAPVVTGAVPSAFLIDSGTGTLTITGYAPSVPILAGVPLVVEDAPAAAPDFLLRLKAVLPHGWFRDDTPILDGVLSGCAAAWATCYDLLAYVRPQTRIATATGVFLDLMANDYFADRLKRFVNENDPRFSLRIRANLLPQRGTRAGVIAAVTALVGEPPTIFEPANTGDTGAWGGGYAPVWRGMAYGVAGGWGSLALPFQAFVSTARPRNAGLAFVNGYGGSASGWGVGAGEWTSPDMIVGLVPDEAIYQTVSDAAPAGSIMWTRLGGAATGTWDGGFIWDSGIVWV